MRRLITVAALLAAAGVAAGCTSPGTAPAPRTSTSTETVTATRPVPNPSPIDTGPTTARTVSACPLLSQQAAADKVGMRLARITVLRSGGKLVGCRFYALQNSPLAQSEHLPGPNQPAIEITSIRFADATSAHNAFIRLAEAGRNLQQATIARGNVGLCYQTDFYKYDKGADWACTFSVGTTQVVIKTVVTAPALNAILVARAVVGKF